MTNKLPETYVDDATQDKERVITTGNLVSSPDPQILGIGGKRGFRITESGPRYNNPDTGVNARLRPDGYWNIGITGNTQNSYFPDIELSGNNDEKFGKIALTLQKNLLDLIKPDTPSGARREFFLKYGIDIPDENLREESMIKAFAAAFTIGNSWIFESLDPTKKAGFFSEIGVRIDGGRATLDDAGMINQLGFSGFFGIALREGEVPSIGPGANIRRSVEHQNGGSTEQVALISFTNLVARMTLRKPVIQGSNSVWFGRVFSEVNSTRGLHVGVGVEKMSMTGKGYLFDVGYGIKGPLIRFGRSDMIAGGENFSRTFTLSGIYTEMHYSPGVHIIDQQGHIYGQMSDVFQFIHHTPEMAQVFRQVVTELNILEKKKQIIIHTEFASKLDSPEKMREFLALLVKNRDYFLSPACEYESIHFDDVGSKKTHETVPRLSQLHIHSLSYRKTGEMNQHTESLGKGERRIESELTKKYNINVQTSLEDNPKTTKAIDILIGRMEKHGGIEKLRGKNITITPDTTLGGKQEVIHHSITSSEKYQEILIPVGVLDAIVAGSIPIIPFTQTPEDTAKYIKLKEYFKFDSDLIPVIHIVDDRDQNLQTPGNEGSFSPYSGENGIMYVSKTYYTMLEKVMNKGARDNLGFIDSFSIKGFERALKGAHVKNIDYLSTEMQKVFQTSADARKNLSREIGGSTLYDIRPSSSKNTQSGEYLGFDVHKSVTHEHTGGFAIKIDDAGLHIAIEGDREYILTSPIDPRAQELFQRYTWLEKFLLGAKGTNPRTGKVEYLQANIQKLAKI